MKRISILMELAVPGIMLGFAGLYLYDAHALSWQAMAFPLSLIGVLAVCLAGVAAERVFGRERGAETEPSTLAPRAWSVVLMPLAAIMLWRVVGALPALLLLVAAAQIALGERRPLRIAVLSVAVAVPVFLLFKELLYVRLPAGIW